MRLSPARTHRARARPRQAALVVALMTLATSGCSLLRFAADARASTQSLAEPRGPT